MSAADPVFALPERDELLAKLAELNDDHHTVEHFHSRIAEHAGRSFTPLGLIMMYTLATSDYVTSRGLGNAVMANLEVATWPYMKRMIPEGPALEQARCFLVAMGLPVKD